MIIVKNVEVIEVDKTRYEIIHMNPMDTIVPSDGTKPCKTEFIKEAIEGKCFTNREGKPVYIGWSRQAQKALELPFRVFENITRINDELECENRELNEALRQTTTRLIKIQSMGFWRRLKKLFTGY